MTIEMYIACTQQHNESIMIFMSSDYACTQQHNEFIMIFMSSDKRYSLNAWLDRGLGLSLPKLLIPNFGFHTYH